MHAFMALDALPFKEGATREMVGFLRAFYALWCYLLSFFVANAFCTGQDYHDNIFR